MALTSCWGMCKPAHAANVALEAVTADRRKKSRRLNFALMFMIPPRIRRKQPRETRGTIDTYWDMQDVEKRGRGRRREMDDANRSTSARGQLALGLPEG